MKFSHVVILACLILLVVGGLIFIKSRIDQKNSVSDLNLTSGTPVTTEESSLDTLVKPTPTPDDSFVIMNTQVSQTDPADDSDIIIPIMGDIYELTPRGDVLWIVGDYDSTNVIENELIHENMVIKFCLSGGKWDSGFEDEVYAKIVDESGEIIREVIGPLSGTIMVAGADMQMDDFSIVAGPCP
jgi:hypothetical protein